MRTPESANGEAVSSATLRAAFANAFEDLHRATRIVRTVWLALNSPSFDASDVGDVSITLCEAFETLEKVREAANLANEAEIQAEIERGAAE